jgi:methionyl-tRNA formyltransferase
LLPLHRGPTPIESVILNGESFTGVSLMKLAKEMDSGPVYSQSEIALAGNETKQQLADSLADIGRAMLIELLPGIISGQVIPKPQNNSMATYDELIQKKDGQISWNNPARKIYNQIRAYAGWPGSRTLIAGKDVIITNAIITNKKGTRGKVFTTGKEFGIFADDYGLIIDRLKPTGKKEMTGEEFLRGYGQKFQHLA